MAIGLRSQSRRAILGSLIGLVVLGSAGCSNPATSVPTATPQQVEWTGTFENGCSPVDAAGIIFELTAPELDGFVQIAMWADLSFEPGSRHSLETDDSMAVAALCRATNDCQVARGGEMLILQATDRLIQGEMWLDLPQAGFVKGSFEAQWVDSGPVICG